MALHHISSFGARLLLIPVVASAMSGCKKAEITVAPPVPVDVMAVTPASGAAGRTFSGTVEAQDVTPVSFSVPGTITELLVEEGDRVTRGATLARVKSESLENASNIAQAELREARDAYNRLKKLHDADALPDIKWVEIQSKLSQAENAAAMAHRAVADATITSPVSGVVSKKFAEKGSTVIAAQPVVEITGLSSLRASISVPEEEITQFADGQTARVTIGSLGNMALQGTDAVKSVVADPFTRSYNVKFSIPNNSGKVLPGMICSVEVASEARADTSSVAAQASMLLPPQAVLLDSDNTNFVWIVSKGHAQRRPVGTRGIDPRGILVDSGLHPGDSVIVAGMAKVSNGTPVAPRSVRPL